MKPLSMHSVLETRPQLRLLSSTSCPQMGIRYVDSGKIGHGASSTEPEYYSAQIHVGSI